MLMPNKCQDYMSACKQCAAISWLAGFFSDQETNSSEETCSIKCNLAISGES